jgi:hypothetical protein
LKIQHILLLLMVSRVTTRGSRAINLFFPFICRLHKRGRKPTGFFHKNFVAKCPIG